MKYSIILSAAVALVAAAPSPQPAANDELVPVVEQQGRNIRLFGRTFCARTYGYGSHWGHCPEHTKWKPKPSGGGGSQKTCPADQQTLITTTTTRYKGYDCLTDTIVVTSCLPTPTPAKTTKVPPPKPTKPVASGSGDCTTRYSTSTRYEGWKCVTDTITQVDCSPSAPTPPPKTKPVSSSSLDCPPDPRLLATPPRHDMKEGSVSQILPQLLAVFLPLPPLPLRLVSRPLLLDR
ncbi:hypothetical protein B0I75DRAFT_4946 [Yarrowia lipolytica]|nr:hypothetical protein B0I74DRAFT_7490 [Yarrowia lipolytica]RDW50444.1 hypothetical protein B0I75DRAFT_4946 [Yarrowia lipolytica]